MPAENVEIVRGVYEALARGDSDAVLAAYDEDVEFDLSRSPFREFFAKHVVHGHDGLRDFFRERLQDWEWIEDESLEIRAVGGRVVTDVVSRGRARVSGIETERRHHAVWTIRGGKVTRVEWFSTGSEALEAARPGPSDEVPGAS